MKQYNPSLNITLLCRLFGKSRQAWYDHCQRKDLMGMHYQIILKLAVELRFSLPAVGAAKLYYMLQPILHSH